MSASGMSSLEPLKGLPLAITAVALAIGTFMQVLDATIANVSLPTISGNLGASTDQGTWVITAFAVSNGVTVPLTGWLMRRYGVVRTFVYSVIAFTLASFLCGIAWNLPVLILFRVLQGGVSGPMIPGSQTLLLSIFPPDKRSTALGIWSVTSLVGPVLGPILGGYISDNFHWSWIFLINVPVGFVAAFFCWTNLANRETVTQKNPIDTFGLVLLVVWVGCLQVMLDTGKDADWYSSPAIVIETIMAVVGCTVWIIWEWWNENPVVDLCLFKFRNFSLGIIALCLGWAVFFANTLLLPLWLQTNVGYTATWAGLVLAPSGAVAVLLTPVASRIMANSDARIMATVAFVALATSCFMRAGYTQDAGFWDFVMPMIVQGIFTSIFFIAMVTISFNGIPSERIPSASGMLNFARITAGGFATSIITTMWDRRETLHQSQLADVSTFYNPATQRAIEDLHQFGIGDRQAYGILANNLQQQSYLLSSTDLFWISGWLSIAVIAPLWVARKSYSSGPPTPASD